MRGHTSSRSPVLDLTVRQHFPIKFFGAITASQLAAAKRLVKIEQMGDQLVLAPRQTRAGTARLGRVTFRVPPPMPARTFLGLLSVADRIELAPHLVMPLEDESSAPMFEAVLGGALVVAAEQAARVHIKQSYVTRRQRLEVLRGRPVWSDEVGRPKPRMSITCDYEIKTTDILPNALIAAGLDSTRHNQPRGPLRRRAERQAFAWMGLAQPPPVIKRQLFQRAQRQLDLHSKHYRSALTLAEAVLLGSKSLGDELGDEVGLPIFDLAFLFEKFFERLVEAIVGSGPLTIAIQTPDRRALKDGAGKTYRSIRPDIVLHRGERPVAVFDAKFKPGYGAGDKVSTADIFQVFFYTERLRRRSPSTTPIPGFFVAPRIDGASADIRPVSKRTIVFSDGHEPATIRLLLLSLVEMVDDLLAGSDLANAAKKRARELFESVDQLARSVASTK